MIKEIQYKGKTYKHISCFKQSRNTIKQQLWRKKQAGNPLEDVIKLRGGYYIEIKKQNDSKKD